MDNIFVWCAALSLPPFCLDYISLGLGNMTENSLFFSFTHLNVFDTAYPKTEKKK